ncbi:FAD/NAD-P-binding domain-containing protein [Mycena vulgaris]|nr:FAD/NAD-P-binding domain-containing protein [Mycena vulgaris]
MHPPKAVVVGAGPVGCLSAMALANLGWHVTIYEQRPDLRSLHPENSRQRSINLTLSARGIAAIRAIDNDILERLLQNTVPLRARMVHYLDGNAKSQQYDRDGQCLYSIERGFLNAILLGEAESFKNIQLYFLHQVRSVDFEKNSLHLQDRASGQEFDVDFDLCIGADGSHSVIRRYLMQARQMEYSQHYLAHEYIEIKLPHGVDSSGQPTFLLDPDHLHVWPRGNFTMVAIPNKNKSFTCAFFAPASVFDALQYPNALIPWFRAHFPDLLFLLGEKQLLSEFQRNPRSQLITTKANPYNKGTVVIIGDAAHSMVPFYGQGLNASLEDVRILSILLQQEQTSPGDKLDPVALSRVLEQYSESRHNDLLAICDLAMDNHLKLRHTVATWSYAIKGFIDNILYAISAKGIAIDKDILTHAIYGPKSPSGWIPWIPLYTMVSFRPDISYSAAKRKAESQERLIERVGMGIGMVIGLLVILGLVYLNSNRQ